MKIMRFLFIGVVSEWIQKCEEDCLSSFVILFSSRNYSTPQNGLEFPRISSVKDVLLPVVRNEALLRGFVLRLALGVLLVLLFVLCLFVFVCVCMCVCVYVCMCVCVYVCMCVCVYVCLFVCMYVCMYVCLFVCLFV